MRIRRSLHKLKWRLKAIHWVYLLLYLVLFVGGLLLVMTKGPILVGIGGSLIASAMAGWVLFLHAWLSQGGMRRLEILQRFGLVEVFDQRSVGIKEEYHTRLERVRESIDIMGFGLRHLREDYQGQFRDWSRHARVRILLLDPEFFSSAANVADQRDLEENDQTGTIQRDVKAFVRDCSSLIATSQANFEVRLYRCLPSINLFRIDGILFWGPYLIGDVSRNLPTLLVDEAGVLFHRMLDHFDTIWSSDQLSRAIPKDWIVTDESENTS